MHYELRHGRLTLRTNLGERVLAAQVGAQSLVLDGERWERIDGRVVTARIDGRYTRTRSIPGIESSSETIEFANGGRYRHESITQSVSPSAPPSLTTDVGRYGVVGDALEFVPDGGAMRRVQCLAGYFQGSVPSVLFMNGTTMSRLP